jgi:hypothetical protein
VLRRVVPRDLLTRLVVVAYILVNVAFTALLIPMLIALFYFASNRTSPVFICAVVTIFFGMLQGTTIAGTTVRLRPPRLWPPCSPHV